MKALVRYVTRKSRGGTAVRDDHFESEVVRIGRGTDCEVQLTDPRILLEHARISVRSGSVYVEAMNGSSVTVNDKLIDASKVTILDVLMVGPFRVIIEPEKGDTDLTLSIELVSTLGDELENLTNRANFNIGAVGLSKRAWSWSMFGAFLFAILLLPLMMYIVSPAPEFDIATAVRTDMEASPTAIWTSGGISAAHKFFGENCEVCHEKPFVQVRDSACLSCHQAIENHADPVQFASASFEGDACQSCHKEHQGNQTIIRNDQDFCVSCHGTLEADEPSSTLRNVWDFAEDHPEFRPSVVIDASLHIISRDRGMTDTPAPRESSGLSFSHADHMRDVGVRHPTRGNVNLECESCHVADDGGVSMLPISFETHCHQCHELKFDTQLPGRQLIHGKPEVLFEQVSDIYNAVAMRGGYEEPTAPEIIRRRPGTELTEQEKVIAENWADGKSQDLLNGRFGRGQCDECHQVFDNPSTGIWVIEPVHVTEQWFPKSVFNHDRHDDMSCATCHATLSSDDSADVLLPTVETCQTCHGGEQATNRVPSTCITCHEFHFEHQGPMRPDIEASVKSHRSFAVIAPSDYSVVATAP